jgi:DNA polymerase-3 subunit alpha (Gram-positive type)
MDDKLANFLASINYKTEQDLGDLKIAKVILKKRTETFEVFLTAAKPLLPNLAEEIIESAQKGINGDKKCLVHFNYDLITDEDILITFKYLFNNLITKKPALSSLKDAEVNIDAGVITIEVTTKIEAELINDYKKELCQELSNLGFNNLDLNTEINQEKNAAIKKAIEETIASGKVTNDAPKSSIILGKHIDGELTKISAILGDVTNIIVEAYVFGKETRNTDKTNIMTLKISDKTNSIIAKFFVRELSEFNEIDKNIKENKWYRIHGNVKYDDFAKDLVLMIRNMESIAPKEITLTDDAEVKRVELHAHTMMSTMDSVVGLDLEKHTCDLTDLAMKLGMRGVAITDHNGCQGFPIVFENIKKFNKGKEDKDKFKGLYGVELNVVNDDVDIVFNNNAAYNLITNEFVVFDTETTGLYVGNDQMIEIGAVKIKNGKITDRFDELINPGHPLPPKITELTNITDEMLKGKDTEENVTKRFLNWAGDLPMVAHNAKFDIGFMVQACKKYNLPEFNRTVADTMGIARMLYPDWSNHKLSTLVKKLDVEWNEDEHHRADYDAEGTAKCFYKMGKTLFDRNIETTTDINNQVNIKDIVRFARPFHMNIIAQNKMGLKNLFKIVSIANTTYLFKNSQPKIPRHELLKYREGLLFGSGCINNEIFEAAKTKDDEELVNMMQFYDYIEVQPISAMTQLLQLDDSGFHSEAELQNHLKKIIRVAKAAGKIVVATGDVHNLTSEDLISRKIIVRQKNNGHMHPLYHRGVDVPDMRFLTTKEMLDAFSFLDKDLAYEIVVTNTNKICDMIDDIEVIIDTGGKPFAPTIKDSAQIIDEMVRSKAKELYGDPLPDIIKERVDHELKIIIDDHYDVEYLIAEKLVKKSNDDGFLVGSRGSVGSSFVATMLGITEVNPLSAHYRCPKCKYSIFNDEKGTSLGSIYSSGFDLPDKDCPKCGTKMVKDGNDMPFATFLGFNGDKVPDIDLNFSDLNQAAIHDYCKVLFGKDNAYRAGTISTVAEKTAFGYVKGYCEDNGIVIRSIETERLAKGCTGVKRTTGQHPGGIVVIPEYMDVFDFTPFQFPAEDPTAKWRTTHFDYHSIQDDVLKLDILGHTDPTQLRMIKDLTGMDPRDVPLDDKETMGIFLSPKPLGVTSEQINCPTGTLGVPEFGTPFTIQLVQDTKPTSFAELIKISGLSHGTDVWLGNAQELIKNKVVPFKEVIGCRDDIMVYLMYHGLEPLKAFKIMEFVRKGKPSKDPTTWAEHVKTMKENGIEEWFISSCGKIKYMFPKAHAAAYVTSAFRIAWFKVHMPGVYYATYFSTRFDDFDLEAMVKGYDAIRAKMLEIQNKGYDATNKEASVLETLKLALEATARGFKFGNIDIEASDGKNFILAKDGKTLICPFRTLDGLGDEAAKAIIEARHTQPFISVEDLQNRGHISQTTIDKLRLLGVLDGMPETSQLSLF